MARHPVSHRLSTWLASHRGSWISVGTALVLIVAVFGALSGAEAPVRSSHAPADSESTRVAELLGEFPDSDAQSILVVASRDDGRELTADDLDDLSRLSGPLSAQTSGEPSDPVLSDDEEAAVIIAPITVGESNGETADIIDALRAELSAHAPPGLVLEVTGGPAFGADIASAFDGADFTLLLVTILIVALLLILTYRSPVLWLIPLIVIALADRFAGLTTAAVGEAWALEFDAGIISVLVFGAGTNYALLLISRYREELQRTDDDRAALSSAWRKTAPALLASNATVVLALLTLLLASIPLTRGLGIPAAMGLIIALAAVLFVLPPVLALLGRRVFWPFIPRPGEARRRGGAWRAVAERVVRRPGVSLLAGGALLAVMAAGLFGTSVGLDQMEKFRVQSESAAGLETLSAHFPPGEAQPIDIVTDSAAADAVVSAAAEVAGVVRAHPVASTGDGALTQIMVTSEYTPGSERSLAQISDLRSAVHDIANADARVGGAAAEDFDARDGNAQDLLLVAPLVLAVCFLILLVLLRSVVAPMLLIVVNLASAVAAIGAGAWLSRVLFDQHALDVQVPILAFLFLIALGIDYTIFLVHRARGEAARHGTRAGMIESVAHTGSVITSAGIVLAAVFAALGVLPLVTLGQLGLIVGLGVVVDTLVVRTVIVPAIFSLGGDRVWWPSRIRADTEESADTGTPTDTGGPADTRESNHETRRISAHTH